MSFEATDHVELGVSRLLEQFSGSVNLIALLSSYLKSVQTVDDDCVVKLLTERDIDAAEGDRLDIIGQIVLVSRSGRNDADYRNAIKVELQILRSTGDFDDIYALLLVLIPDHSQFAIVELFPKSVIITPIGDHVLTQDPNYVGTALGRAVTLGTHMNFVYQLVPDAELYLTSSQIDQSETSVAIGLADDAQTQGGKLAGVVSNGY